MRHLLLILIINFRLLAFSQESLTFSVSGNIKGGRGEKVVLLDMEALNRGEPHARWETVIDNNENFSIHDKLKYAGRFDISVKGKKMGVNFYLDTVPVKLQGKVGESLRQSFEVSSEQNTLYLMYRKETSDIFEKYQNIQYEEYAKIMGIDASTIAEMDKKNRDNLIDSLYPGTRARVLRKANDYLYKARETQYSNYVRDYPGAFIILDAVAGLLDKKRRSYPDKNEEVLNSQFLLSALEKLPDIVKLNPRFSYVKNQVRAIDSASPQVGTILPKFSLENEKTEIISLSEIVSNNKYTLVDFWASWCGPCIEESKKIEEFYPRYKHRKFEVFAVTIDQNKKAWLNALENLAYPWPQGYGYDDPTIASFKIYTIPANFLLNHEGEVVKINLSHSELEAFLKTHL
ncbi:TlpA family protein disulfide reductase [Parapedobacter luteus]|uniref:TlpA family protein disulfide reductase n=1 Tax=Parapedobacter luteus TaxID=623280 RepID=UPI0009A81814|nr:TlpA disulfide reductase family protein [Parapedobacter luteus]